MSGVLNFVLQHIKMRAMAFIKPFLFILLGFLVVYLPGCEIPQSETGEQVPDKTASAEGCWDKPKEYSFEVINKIESDPRAFTQGLVVHDGFFYLGTGGSRFSSKITGRQSFIIKIDIQTGTILFKEGLNTKYFGEGITILNDHLYQLTWKNRTAFVYPLNNLNIKSPIKTFTYYSQGWGLTNNGKQLIMSNGTATLYFLDPETFKVERTLLVKDRDAPVLYLNELEFVEGEIFANIFQKNHVARISAKSGQVTGWIDFNGLRESHAKFPGYDVLNGIAYDSEKKKLYLTGKLWKNIYEVKIIDTHL